MERVVIAVDPHKLSVTIEVVDRQEQLRRAARSLQRAACATSTYRPPRCPRSGST
jgi:PII-like signaling protein